MNEMNFRTTYFEIIDVKRFKKTLNPRGIEFNIAKATIAAVEDMIERTDNKFLHAPSSESTIRKNINKSVLSQISLHGIICLLLQSTEENKFKQPYTKNTIQEVLNTLSIIHEKPEGIDDFRKFFAGLDIPEKFGDLEITINKDWCFEVNDLDASDPKPDEKNSDSKVHENIVQKESTPTVEKNNIDDYQAVSEPKISYVDNDKIPEDIIGDEKGASIINKRFKIFSISGLILLVAVATLFYFNKKDNTLSEQEQLKLKELQRIQPDDPFFTYDRDSILSLRRTTGISNVVIFPKSKDLNFVKSLKYTLDSLKIKDSLFISTYINKYSVNNLDSLYRNMHYKHIDYVIIEKADNKVQLLFPQTIHSIANPIIEAKDFQSGTMDAWLSALSNIEITSNNKYLGLWIASNLHNDNLFRLKYLDRIKLDFPEKQIEQNYLLHKAHILRQLVSDVNDQKEDPIWDDIFAIYEQLLFLNPQTNDHYSEYASYKKSKDRFLAEELITKAIALKDSSLYEMQYLDRAFLRSNQMQKHQEALNDFQTAFQFSKNELLKFHILRRAIKEKLTLKDYGGAIDDYQTLAKKDIVSGFQYFIKIADCYAKMEQKNNALEYYTKYINTYKERFPKEYKNDETIGEAYFARSSIYLTNLAYDKAIKDIDSAKVYRFNPDLALIKEISVLRKQFKHKKIMSRLKDYKARDTYKQQQFDSLTKLLNIELILLEDNQLNTKQKDSIRHIELTDDPYFTKLFFYGSTFKKDAFFMQ